MNQSEEEKTLKNKLDSRYILDTEPSWLGSERKNRNEE